MASIGVAPGFTTTEAVRAALGIDSVDLDDQRILDAGFDLELRIDLSQWYPNYAAGLAGSATDEEKLLSDAIKTYSKFFCAAKIAASPLTFIQLYSDGKAEQRRFTNFNWEDLLGRLLAEAGKYRQVIAGLTDDAAAADTSGPTLLSLSSPSYNPVTNEGGS